MKVPFTCLAIHVPKAEISVKAQGTGSHSHPEFVGFRNCRLDTRILKIEIKKNGISPKQFRFKRFRSKFMSSRFPHAWGPGGARGASTAISRTRALRLAKFIRESSLCFWGHKNVKR